MIRFALQCDDGHRFESWFQNSAAYDSLKASGHVTCAICGSGAVDKAVMAPAVSTTAPPAATATPGPLEKLREHVEKTADYVGTGFAEQARKMHLGDLPDRPIYGEAAPKEARALLEDGVPVMPLPFIPKKRAN